MNTQAQSNIVAGLIQNIGTTTANRIKSRNLRQTKELQYIQEKQAKEQLALYATDAMQKKVIQNYKDSGLASDSFFKMAYNNISDLSIYDTRRKKAQSQGQRQKASEEYAMAQARDSQTQYYINYYKGWLETYTKELQANAKNQPGGVFTGTQQGMKGGHFNEFSEETNKNFLLKNALLGVQMNKEGTDLLPPVDYYQKKDGTLMGKLKGYEDFDVLATISKPPVVIQDFQKTLGALFTESGYKDGNGQIKKEFLNYDELDEYTKTVTGSGGDTVQVTTRQVPINIATSNRWLQQVEQVFQGQLRAINNKNDFDNMQASYMSIAGAMDVNNDGVIGLDEYNTKSGKVQTKKANYRNVSTADMTDLKAQKIKPLTYKNANFQLDQESENRLRAVFLDNAYKDNIGPGYVQELDTPETVVQARARRAKEKAAATKAEQQRINEIAQRNSKTDPLTGKTPTPLDKATLEFSQINPSSFGFRTPPVLPGINDINGGPNLPSKFLDYRMKLPSPRATKAQGKKDWELFRNTIVEANFEVFEETPTGNIIISIPSTKLDAKGQEKMGARSFKLYKDKDITAREFYKEMFTLMGVSRGSVYGRVNGLFGAEVKKDKPFNARNYIENFNENNN